MAALANLWLPAVVGLVVCAGVVLLVARPGSRPSGPPPREPEDPPAGEDGDHGPDAAP